MFAASIFQVRCLPQRGNRIRFTGLSEGKPTLRRPLLDVNLSRPIIIVRLGESVLEHAELTDSFLGLGQISAASRTDRAAKPCNRLGLREWRFRNFECRGFRPRSALERITDGYGRKGRMPAVAKARRIFGNAIARIN